MTSSTEPDDFVTVPKPGGRKEESRRKILAAARKLFVEKGYHDTRPQDVARLAGIGHGTFYLHFADKKACFLAFVAQARDEVTESSLKRIEGVEDLEGQTRGIFETALDYGEQNPGVLEAAMTDPGLLASKGDSDPDANMLEGWGNVWADLLAEHKRRGTVSPDLDVELAGQAIVGMLRQCGVAAQRRELDRTRLVDGVVRFVLGAVG